MRGLKFGVGLAALLAASLGARAETTVLENVTVIDGTVEVVSEGHWKLFTP